MGTWDLRFLQLTSESSWYLGRLDSYKSYHQDRRHHLYPALISLIREKAGSFFLWELGRILCEWAELRVNLGNPDTKNIMGKRGAGG